MANKWMNSYSVIEKFLGRISLKNMDKKRYQEFISGMKRTMLKVQWKKFTYMLIPRLNMHWRNSYPKNFANRPTITESTGVPDSHKLLEEDFKKIMSYVSDSMNSSNLSYVMISITIRSGARLSKIANLIYEDFDFKKIFLTLIKHSITVTGDLHQQKMYNQLRKLRLIKNLWIRCIQ